MSRRGDNAGGPARDARADRLAEVDVHALLGRRRQVAIVWSVEDVLHVRPDLSADQAWEILLLVRDRHDAEQGVCWETLWAGAEALYPQAGEAL